jgi:Na+/H+ antiporter NhaD/arsenite permease-like protein
MTTPEILALVVFVGAYALIAAEKFSRSTVALVGGGLMLLLRLTDGPTVYHSAEAGIDWNVVFLLLGMMLIVGVIRRTGVFEYLAIAAARRARGRPYRVMVTLLVLTAAASALLDNVTTVLLVAPVTFLVCERIGVRAAPFLIAEALASNIGGTATLIGDPPNIIIASRAGLSFNDFVVHLAPFIVVLLVVFLVLCRVLFRSDLTADADRVAEVMSLRPREAIRDTRLLVQSLGVLALVLAGFVTSPLTGLAPSVVALLGAGLLLLISSVTSQEALAEVEWETLVFFAGLFVMVGALVNTGVIDDLAHLLVAVTGSSLLTTAMVLLVGSAVLSAIVDNIPYVATMAPVVAQLVAAHPGTDATVLWWALALGADLGGNATAIGASANVVTLGLAERSGTRITFWEFTRYGALVAALSIALAAPYLWLRYFVL